MALENYISPKNPNNQLQNIGSNNDIDTNTKYIPLTPQGPYDKNNVEHWDGITPITKTQPQIAQLEIKYAGPLIKDSVVAKLADLVKLPVLLNYQHRRVWVKEYGCEYYLDNGNGTRLENWKRAIGRLVVRTWSEYENYQEGDIVNYFGKLYVAKQNITVPSEEKIDEDGNVVRNEYGIPVLIYSPNQSDNPLVNENKWQVVTGEIETYSWHFGNVNQIQIRTEIRNPRFEVCLGELALDKNGDVIYNTETGLPIYKNIEIVEACIRQGVLNKDTGEVTQFDSDGNYDLDDGEGNTTADSDYKDGGVPYAIQLFTDEIITADKTYYDTEIIEKNKLNKTTRTKFDLIVSIK